jgi:hypothetical protein
VLRGEPIKPEEEVFDGQEFLLEGNYDKMLSSSFALIRALRREYYAGDGALSVIEHCQPDYLSNFGAPGLAVINAKRDCQIPCW